MGEEIFAGLGSLYYVPGGIGKDGEIVGEPQEVNISESKLEMAVVDLGANKGDKPVAIGKTAEPVNFVDRLGKIGESWKGENGFSIQGKVSFDVPMSKEIMRLQEELTNDLKLVDDCFDIDLLSYNMEAIRLHKQKIDVTPFVYKRIPRKMKKALKKRYGDKWMCYHPNADFNVEITNKE